MQELLKEKFGLAVPVVVLFGAWLCSFSLGQTSSKAPAAPAASAPPLSAKEIVRRAMEHDVNNWQQEKNYTFLQRIEQRELASGTLEVDVQVDLGEARGREMGQGVFEANVPGKPRVEDRVRQDQLAVVTPDVELDHVDAHLQRGVKRGQRVRRRQRTGAAMTNSLTAVGVHGALPG